MTEQNGQNEQATGTKNTTLTLNLRRVWDDGGAAYEADGIRGTIYIKKGFFEGDAPATLSLTGVLATPAAIEAAPAEGKAEDVKSESAATETAEGGGVRITKRKAANGGKKTEAQADVA